MSTSFTFLRSPSILYPTLRSLSSCFSTLSIPSQNDFSRDEYSVKDDDMFRVDYDRLPYHPPESLLKWNLSFCFSPKPFTKSLTRIGFCVPFTEREKFPDTMMGSRTLSDYEGEESVHLTSVSEFH